MNEIRTCNALISSTMLGIEDHGSMTCMLYLDYGGCCQGAGGYCLDAPVFKGKKFRGRVGTAKGMDMIMKILKIVGVEKWEDLPNKHIRVKASHSKVHAIGNVLRDEWLDFAEFWK